MDISPDKQNIDAVFSNTRFYIDFYQRDYRWSDEPVIRLLDDVFYKFNDAYEKHSHLDSSEEIVAKHYPWYYLNTYVTNKVGGRVFIVDGQQRLTTLTLITMKLLHIAQENGSELQNWLDRKIAGYSGKESEFWMNHEGHKPALQSMYRNELEDVDTSTGITAINIERNFLTISRYLDNQLTKKEKFETFVYYFLQRLVLIELSVVQTDVPMVFEVINDRGVKLQPFEILKGKLLGQIDKDLLEQKEFNVLWEDRVNLINYDRIDDFFRTWLKARFANVRSEGQKFDGDYHRIIFTHEFQDKLSLDHNEKGVIEFLEGPFSYYTLLYRKIQDGYQGNNSALFYNRLNDLDGSFMLLMSSCKINDPEETQKISIIPRELDRLFTLLQLQGAYDSNAFQELLFKISAEIRDGEVSGLRVVFDQHLMAEISKRRSTEVGEPFRYPFFKQAGISFNARFKRYFFSRIEEFFAREMNLNMKHSMEDLVSKTGAKTGFHIEHILAHNDENYELFGQDEERFEQERNRLGAILLLKGKDNISSSNESYAQKLKSYANTLYWNETLREDTYKSKLDIDALKSRYGLDLEPMNEFGPEELEQRQKLLYQISSIVWS